MKLKKTKPKSLKFNLFLIALSLLIFLFTFLQSGEKDISTPQVPENYFIERLEIPTKLTDRPEQIITHTGFTVSYNYEWKIPNWVAYHHTKEKVDGTVPRAKHFKPDPNVPNDKTATNDDYRNTGWDKGHLAPAADMKWSEKAMKESFYFSNVCPQNPNLNSGIWKDLEEQVRDLTHQKGSIYVVCGPVVSKQPRTIGNNKVAVPDSFFKALLQNENGKWSAIAFLFENESGKKPLSTYAITVEELQYITNIDFFPTLPDDIENEVEKNVDFTKWNVKTNR